MYLQCLIALTAAKSSVTVSNSFFYNIDPKKVASYYDVGSAFGALYFIDVPLIYIDKIVISGCKSYGISVTGEHVKKHLYIEYMSAIELFKF